MISNQAPGSQDCELNMASIIDCFTVVLTYLLASASFLSVGVFDVGVALQGSATETPAPPPALSLDIRLTLDRSIQIRLAGLERLSLGIPARDGDWDYSALNLALESMHEKWPALQMASMGAEGLVDYRALVRGVETVRKSIPQVIIGTQEVQ